MHSQVKIMYGELFLSQRFIRVLTFFLFLFFLPKYDHWTGKLFTVSQEVTYGYYEKIFVSILIVIVHSGRFESHVIKITTGVCHRICGWFKTLESGHNRGWWGRNPKKRGYLKCHGILISATLILGDKVIGGVGSKSHCRAVPAVPSQIWCAGNLYLYLLILTSCIGQP